MFSRILTLFAGALISAVILRKREASPAGGTPWSADLEELQKRLTEILTTQDGRLDDLRQQFEAMVAEASARSSEPAADLTARLADLYPKIEAMARKLEQQPDRRIDELAVRIGQLQPKIEALAMERAPRPDPRVDAVSARLDAVESNTIAQLQGQVAELRQAVVAQDQRLQAANKVVIAIEQMLATKMVEFDRRLEVQGRTLQAMNSSIAQSDELLERLLDLVQAGPQSAGEPVPAAPAAGEARELRR
jgi:chromosome segregation ATPase